MHLPIGLLTRLSRRFEKILLVQVIVADVLAPVLTTHHMVDRSRIINPLMADDSKSIPRDETRTSA